MFSQREKLITYLNQKFSLVVFSTMTKKSNYITNQLIKALWSDSDNFRKTITPQITFDEMVNMFDDITNQYNTYSKIIDFEETHIIAKIKRRKHKSKNNN